jgi:transmembrane sensor
MSDEKQRQRILLEKYRDNNLSQSEFKEFLKIIGEAEGQRIMHDMSASDWAEAEGMLQEMRNNEPLRQNRPGRIIRMSLSVAASIALLLALYFYLPEKKDHQNLITYQTLYGETKSVLLPDSSTVLMNANSRIVWDGAWKGIGTRKVRLDGEGFFEVKKVKGSNFIVESGELKVNVLGTVFNIRSRRGNVEVFLESGKVNLELADAEHHSVPMMPGNSVHYNKEKKDLTLVKSSSLTHSASWVDGMLVFQNESVKDILFRFEELYGKKFQIENKALLDKRMDLSLPYSNWDLISKALKISLQVEFTEKQDTVIVR